MPRFKVGDRVGFQADGRGPVEGMLTRYNRPIGWFDEGDLWWDAGHSTSV